MTNDEFMYNEFYVFLRRLPLKNYGSYKTVKWVEQDLPADPVPNIYSKEQEHISFSLLHIASMTNHYWFNHNFSPFEDWFKKYWDDIQNNSDIKHVLDKFKLYYFDGALYDWFKQGFEARMYRTWFSLLTQLQFQYLWDSLFPEKITYSVALDSLGIDAQYTYNNKKVGIQIKKVSFRREVSKRSFVKKQKQYCDFMVNAPYQVIDINEEIRLAYISKYTNLSGKQKHTDAIVIFFKYFNIIVNGFFCYNERYLRLIHDHVAEIIDSGGNDTEIDFYAYVT